MKFYLWNYKQDTEVNVDIEDLSQFRVIKHMMTITTPEKMIVGYVRCESFEMAKKLRNEITKSYKDGNFNVIELCKLYIKPVGFIPASN